MTAPGEAVALLVARWGLSAQEARQRADDAAATLARAGVAEPDLASAVTGAIRLAVEGAISVRASAEITARAMHQHRLPGLLQPLLDDRVSGAFVEGGDHG